MAVVKFPIPCEDRTSPYVLDILVHRISSVSGNSMKSSVLHVRPDDGIRYIESHFTPCSDVHPTLRLYPGPVFYFEYSPRTHSWNEVNQIRHTTIPCNEETVRLYAQYLGYQN